MPSNFFGEVKSHLTHEDLFSLPSLSFKFSIVKLSSFLKLISQSKRLYKISFLVMQIYYMDKEFC